MPPSPFCLNIMIMIHDKEQDWLPGEGNGGMEQFSSAPNVSMFVAAVPDPPVIIRPALESCVKYKDNTYICL